MHQGLAVYGNKGSTDQHAYVQQLREGVPNFFAYEIDTKDTIEKSKKEIKEKVSWFLKFAEIRTQADAFVESATMNPAFEESAMFENMIDIMFKDEYDVYVFDTAPMPKAIGTTKNRHAGLRRYANQSEEGTR